MPGPLDPLNITAVALVVLNFVALIVLVALVIRYAKGFEAFAAAGVNTVNYGIQQGSATMVRLASDIVTDANNIKYQLLQKLGFFRNTGTGIPVSLEPCKPGYHNDGLTCRKPIECHTDRGIIRCSGGEVYGRLNHGGCCGCDRHYKAGLCYTDCPCDYTPLVFPFSQVCIGNAT